MLKQLLLTLLLCCCLSIGWSQVYDYGNGWYTPTQTYAKLLVWEDGLYRVDAATLAQAGITLTPGSLTNIQLYYRGQEQHIYLKSTSGNLDYVEFYGKRNDGQVDSLMYRDPYTKVHGNNLQPNRHMSLFSDTSAYFLTVGTQPGLRFTDFSDLNFGNYSAETHFPYRTYFEYHPNTSNAWEWNHGGGNQYDIFHILNSYYITGEGLVGQSLGFGSAAFITMPTKYPANLGNPSTFETRVYGRSSWRHILHAAIDGNSVFQDTTFGIYIRTRTLQYNQPIGNQINVMIEALSDQNNQPDNNNICYTAFTYDRLFDMDGQSSILMSGWNKNTNSYLRFANAASTGTAVAYDLTTHTRCAGAGSGNIAQVVVPASNLKREIVVATDGGYRTPLLGQSHLAGHSDPAAGTSFVIIAHRSVAASAYAYETYRDTCTLNPQTAKVVFTDEIYDEFGWGSPTPHAIKRFCKYALDNWTTKPKYILLWGKGQYEMRNTTVNLVPTYGYPADDYDFVSDFDPMQVNPIPQAAVGRVNVYDNADGMIYLNKVMEYEHTPWASWMKEAVFLGGGNDTAEQKPILTYLLQFKTFWESPPMGGNVNYYQKYNTGALTNSTMTATDRINSGSNVIHFFGHSSNNIYDVDIQEPSLYTNYGKYPFMVAFGCYGGNFTGNNLSFGERFILSQGRGAIGYLANSTAGYLTPLGDFGKIYYPERGTTSFGQPIGDQIKATIGRYTTLYTDQVYLNHAKQMNLQGDPSVALYSPKKVDLEISDASIYFTPSNFSAADSFYTVNVITHNNGLVTQDSFYLSISQQLPSGTWVRHANQKFGPILNVDTLSVRIRNNLGSQVAGLNMFDIFVDSTALIDEYREDNNRVTHSVVIPGNTPAILIPYDFAVVDEPQVTLSASAVIMSQLSTVRYLYEIDTVSTFNSPMWTSSPVVVGSAIYSAWNVPFTLTDSMVYYWRVRLADAYPNAWATASFKYIATKRGWAQSRPPQFFTDPTEKVEMDQVNHTWEFDQWSTDLHAYVAGDGHAVYRLANGAYFSNYPSSNTLNGIMYTPIRAKDLKPAITGTINGDWSYAAMPGGQNSVVSNIASLEKGDYFLAVSENNPHVEQWAPHVRAAFSMIGCDTSLLNNFTPGNALVVLGRKDYPGQGIILTTPNVYDDLNHVWQTDLRKTMQSNYAVGKVGSTTVGPAIAWQDLVWNWNSIDPFVDEETKVSLYVSHDGVNDSLYMHDLTAGTYSLAAIDAQRYPFIKLKAALKDSAFLTAPQLKHWHVLYSPAPDAVIDPISVWAFDTDSVTQGESIRVRYAAKNVTDVNMDSLLVRYQVELPDRRLIDVGHKVFPPLLAGQTMEHSYTFSTNYPDVVGDLSFIIELNPLNDQPEQYHFNNLFSYQFHVMPDGINPILDVKVDGKHVMDGDIVSPRPEILIQINDENEHMAVNDTAYEIHFGLKTPNPANLPRVFIQGNAGQMTVESASLPDNKSKLHFRPGHLVDGEYTLRVQGYDFNGNASGKNPYEINFKVVNEIALSNVLNYPNPFSSSTRFVYTLTGSELPEMFEVHIFTISGKLVKVIDLHASNDVKVGYNITDYAWDGRDEFGDELANGVYIYKVVAKLNGQSMKLRDEGITDLFKNGFGKMYLMR
jgi:Peptidase family C25